MLFSVSKALILYVYCSNVLMENKYTAYTTGNRIIDNCAYLIKLKNAFLFQNLIETYLTVEILFQFVSLFLIVS